MRNFEFSVLKGAGVHLFQKFLFHTLIKVSVSAQKKKNPNKQTTLEGNSVLYLASYKTSTEAASWFQQLKSQIEFFCVFSPNFLQEPLLLSLVPSFSFLWTSLGPLPLICAPFTSQIWGFIIWGRCWVGRIFFGHKHPTKRPPFSSDLPQTTPQFPWFYLMATFCSVWGITETVAELIICSFLMSYSILRIHFSCLFIFSAFYASSSMSLKSRLPHQRMALGAHCISPTPNICLAFNHSPICNQYTSKGTRYFTVK